MDALYEKLPLGKTEVDLIHTYMDAAARLYGLISLAKLREIYNAQNKPVDTETFIQVAALRDFDDNDYEIIERTDVPSNTP